MDSTGSRIGSGSPPHRDLKRRAKELSNSDISPPPVSKYNRSDGRVTEVSKSQQKDFNKEPKYSSFPSPFRLTTIRDLPPKSNRDTISLHDILGDPLIRECWIFDYLFDVDYLMRHFDADTRHLVQVKIVHGSWRREDSNRAGIEEAVSHYGNVEAITAYMPEAFGTHHSKMIILFRQDEGAQVIIHTANMIDRDLRNMTQAAWCSPRLPVTSEEQPMEATAIPGFGSGGRFKEDLLRYLRHYGTKKTGPLIDQLMMYDFRPIKAALISSVPTRASTRPSDEDEASFGWPRLKQILRSIPIASNSNSRPWIVSQVSSIASVGQDWLANFFKVLNTSASSDTLGSAMAPRHRVMFPTVNEIRDCLDGYEAGASIHMRTQSSSAQKQLSFLRPFFLRWSDGGESTEKGKQALRDRAAPHVKTYIRYNSENMDQIDWAMLTSANLSTQAWGALAKDGQVRICSYEIGVIVWPAILADDPNAIMQPTFGEDMPLEGEGPLQNPIVGLRIPYDLPIRSYDAHDEPWCASATYKESDWRGRVWSGYGS